MLTCFWERRMKEKIFSRFVAIYSRTVPNFELPQVPDTVCRAGPVSAVSCLQHQLFCIRCCMQGTTCFACWPALLSCYVRYNFRPAGAGSTCAGSSKQVEEEKVVCGPKVAHGLTLCHSCGHVWLKDLTLLPQ